MQGFVLVSLDEQSGEIVEFWTGTTFDLDVSKAQFVMDKTEARTMAGRLQTARPDAEYKAVPATMTISLTKNQQPQPVAA